MFSVEKPNGQIFEVYTSRKEFGENLKWSISYMKDNGGIWTDEDSSLALEYKDGTQVSYSIGDKIGPLYMDKVAKGICDNGSTVEIFNCQIAFNSHYEDWDVIM